MCSTLTRSHAESESFGVYWREPLDAAKHKSPKGNIHLIKDRCKSCGFCIKFCPRGILELSDEFKTKGHHFPRIIEDGH